MDSKLGKRTVSEADAPVVASTPSTTNDAAVDLDGTIHMVVEPMADTDGDARRSFRTRKVRILDG